MSRLAIYSEQGLRLGKNITEHDSMAACLKSFGMRSPDFDQFVSDT